MSKTAASSNKKVPAVQPIGRPGKFDRQTAKAASRKVVIPTASSEDKGTNNTCHLHWQLWTVLLLKCYSYRNKALSLLNAPYLLTVSAWPLKIQGYHEEAGAGISPSCYKCGPRLACRSGVKRRRGRGNSGMWEQEMHPRKGPLFLPPRGPKWFTGILPPNHLTTNESPRRSLIATK